jgi:hypothetical protein
MIETCFQAWATVDGVHERMNLSFLQEKPTQDERTIHIIHLI